MKQKELLENFTFKMSELFALVAISLDDDEPGLWQQNSKDIDKKALDTLIDWNLIYRSNQDCTDEIESLGLTLRGVRLAEWVRDHNNGWLKGATLLKMKK